MKTYILSQLAKLKKTSSDLDEKAEVEKILCGKPWHIFNDGDICETYLFEADGKLRIILGGQVSMAQWEYVEALKCVQLNLNDQQYMLQLSFSDQQLLAMKLYSGNEYCIMIEESRYAECKLKTLNDVQQYFAAVAAKQEKQLQEQKILDEKLEQKKKHQIEIVRIKDAVSSTWLKSDECKDFCKRYKVGLWIANLPDWIAFPSMMVLLGSIMIAIFGGILITKSEFIIAGWLCVTFGFVISIVFGYWVVYSSFLLGDSYKNTYQSFAEKYLNTTCKETLSSEEVNYIVKSPPSLQQLMEKKNH